MSTQRGRYHRPKKRNIVRWDDDLDELLLLSIQSVCNAKSVKIPWADVASTMGHNISEGAIVQHLAKVRSRRVVDKKAVPPSLRRRVANKTSEQTPKKGEKAMELSSDNLEPEVHLALMDPEPQKSALEQYTKKGRFKKDRKSTQKAESNARSMNDDIVKKEFEDEGESDDSEEMLMSGASFLNYPNDRQNYPKEKKAASASPSPVAPGPKPSKIVVLKYRRQPAQTINEDPLALGYQKDPSNQEISPKFYENAAYGNNYASEQGLSQPQEPSTYLDTSENPNPMTDYMSLDSSNNLLSTALDNSHSYLNPLGNFKPTSDYMSLASANSLLSTAPENPSTDMMPFVPSQDPQASTYGGYPGMEYYYFEPASSYDANTIVMNLDSFLDVAYQPAYNGFVNEEYTCQ